MSECVSNFFLYNDEIRKREEFEDNIFKEGKSLYEVIRIIDGKPLFLKAHLDRLNNSSNITDLKLWLGRKEIVDSIFKLIHINEIYSGNVKLIFNFYKNNKFLAYFVEHHYPTSRDYEVGVKTDFFHIERENPNAKVINRKFKVRVNKKITESGIFEAVLVDDEGNITEGSKSNIFMIKGEKVITAPFKRVLPGTTRNIIMQICLGLGLEVLEEDVNYREIDKFDAIFISGTSPKVLPVKSVGNIEFNSSNNKILLQIMGAYNEKIRKDIENFVF
ncbi:aminotransferase class IV [Clostridium sp. MT-14]|uniref:Aminotransferase class IV n=1 Tax=Clostridium aromativorans TaxID=2836848 RepID=A0ABS8N248_9CLOT|nr:aminotransferase class IV [Clostridium aromativorans]MCC9293874.1 aminotransferase class IV [Clostridium aromativorans]